MNNDSVNQVQAAEILRQAISRHVRRTLVRREEELTTSEFVTPVSLAVRDQLVDRMLQTESRYRAAGAKRLYYLSMEFLMGRLLGDTLCNLRLMDITRQALDPMGEELDKVLESETDAGLGNGGLGRLAACFLESMATMGMPGYGYGIDYEYGLFKQEIVNGFQREKPDRWKANGTPFEIPRPEQAIVIPLYGRVENLRNAEEDYRQNWTDYKIVLGVPNDMPVAGYNGETVNFLRLFSARASEDFDIEIFNRGDYIRAVEQKIGMENISRLLYPSDSVVAGRELRLVQEYFLVACAVRDIVRRYLNEYENFDQFARQSCDPDERYPPGAGGGRADAGVHRRSRNGVGAGLEADAENRWPTPTIRCCRRRWRNGVCRCWSACCRGTRRSSSASITAFCADSPPLAGSTATKCGRCRSLKRASKSRFACRTWRLWARTR